MQSELHELRLGPRGRALEHARRAVEKAPPSTGDAREAAFADFTPPPCRTDAQHSAPRVTVWNPREAAEEISAQLAQIEQQRERLTRLLESLEKG